MLLPPWDELDTGVRDWFRGVVLGCILGVFAASMFWIAAFALMR